MSFILASTSPRRRELLSFFSLPFTSAAPLFDETGYPYRGEPVPYVTGLAKEKAFSLKTKYPRKLILGADTVVHYRKKIFEKPANRERALEMLRFLAGKRHEVITGICLTDGIRHVTDHAVTKVLLKAASDNDLRTYIERLECTDKAGGYAVQGAGNILSEEITGCFYNVMGLPIGALERAFRTFGIRLWDYLR